MDIIEKLLTDNIKSFNVKFDNEFEFEILNLGGIITKIITPDSNGNLENIVVGYKDIESYIKNPSYFGAIIGRTSGRICEGKIKIDEVEYNLSKNYNPHNGHGGSSGFDKKIWNVEVIEGNDKVDFKLTSKSLDVEENFSGNLDLIVNFEVKKDFEIIQTYFAKSDKNTLVNMTNHTYFNLSGNIKEEITNENLRLKSDYILEIDETCVPTGEKLDVNNTPFDFRNLKNIGKDIDSLHPQIEIGCGYDHPFLLSEDKNQVYIEDKNGRNLTISTNQEAVVIYSMNFPDDLVLYNGKTKQRRFGICFETQSPPIGRNMCFLENSMLKKDEKYLQETTYKFSRK